MGPPWNGKCNLFTEVLRIAINFNDFFASAFRLEKVEKVLAKRHIFAYLKEGGWNKYRVRAMIKILNNLIFLQTPGTNWKKTWISERSINKQDVMGLLKVHRLQRASERESEFLD